MKHLLLCCDHVFANKQNIQCSHLMDTGWARDQHKSYAGSHAKRLHLTSAFGWGYTTEESRSLERWLIHAHLSQWVMPTEPEYERKQKRQQERQHAKAPSLCCRLAVALTFYADLQPLLPCSWTSRLAGILAAVSGGQQLPEVQHDCTTWDFPAGYQLMVPHKHIPGTLWLALIPKK